MTLVDNVWYDNEIGNTKQWRKDGYKHLWGIQENDDGIQIVKCVNCNQVRMWIGLMELKNCP